MKHITAHSNTITQVKVPLPFPLRWVNSYLVQGSAGYTLIDPGLHTAEAEELWHSALKECGVAFEHIEQIVLTHHHPDHYGMAGWFQERTGAPVLLSETGLLQTQLLWGGEQPMTALLLDLFARHGMDAAGLATMAKHMDGFVAFVSPQPQVTLLREGPVRLGDRAYAAIETPGHAAGHLCFYDAEAETIFCGDHVLPQISPNVSFLPQVEANPLGAYLSSLQDISRLPVKLAYPGHREPWTAFGARAAELIQHHEERLGIMENQLKAKPLTAYEVCLATFGERLSTHQMRFALSETIAHLVLLEVEGRIRQTDQDAEIIRYLAT
ncbi:MBL fold metallo-hydrolase [Paenibacillus eucommiae]|uniref:Glyoxylase-like metal-dependent hydrolase (Beta-lactamase superfamily II) n=1 Tax=Paenibacillus eucommiae TaxID=1355755 RepID=A0ABS4J0C3_9BACL|nr:MBL fold metallo-hydrolase [Paenibacillus eucommiae]MBP1993289.1 glyoxylase-like metal-dependent hydrolase (beta-lactamase superfamily II) [Paenibacillus eucommiae]